MKSIARSDVIVSVASSGRLNGEDERERLRTRFINRLVRGRFPSREAAALSLSVSYRAGIRENARVKGRVGSSCGEESNNNPEEAVGGCAIDDGRPIARSRRRRVTAVRVGTCMALSEPSHTIDRDNSIAGASDASSSGFPPVPISCIRDRGSLNVTSIQQRRPFDRAPLSAGDVTGESAQRESRGPDNSV